MQRKYLILFSLSGAILCLDQFTKHLVQHYLGLRESLTVIPGFLSLVHERNSGFAFGFLEGMQNPLDEIFVIGIPIFALVLIVLIFIKIQDGQMTTSIALTLILGGAMGNLIDRMQYSYVVDFLDVGFFGLFRLPPFNIADCSILVGVAIMVITTLSQEAISETTA